jgi:hypothetical protein
MVTEEKLRVYPNPAYDEVTIQIATKKGESGRLSIMNAQGRMMETFETSERNAIIKLNSSHWGNGIYFIEYNNSSGSCSELQKLMIVK